MSQEMELETFYPHPPERVWQALTEFETDEKNRNVVTVHQIVKNLQGNLLADMTVKQIFTIKNDSIVLYEIGATETIQETIEQTRISNKQ